MDYAKPPTVEHFPEEFPEDVLWMADVTAALSRNVAPNACKVCHLHVHLVGHNPYDPGQFRDVLPDLNIEEVFEDLPEEKPDLVVIGHEDVDRRFLEAYVDKYAPAVPKFLPQAAFVDLLFFGFDWWEDYPELLNRACEYHGNLAFVRSLSQGTKRFRWPTLDTEEATAPSRARPVRPDLQAESELLKTGYSVTKDGGEYRSPNQRWAILTMHALPELGLEGVAKMIAWLVRSRKRQKDGAKTYQRAIKAWSQDLKRLKEEYYDRLGGRTTLRFRWPDAS